jgi:NADH:ubiquinone oxidoreductase subunit F (NADH-binding)/(2Fe-2S) ferredoxin
MTFQETKEKAESIWRDFADRGKRRVLVGGGSCGRAAGAHELMRVIRIFLQESAVPIAVHEVGCLGLCYAEPLVELSAPGMPRVMYRDVTAENVLDLLRDFFVHGRAGRDNAMAVMDGPATDGIPAFAELPMLKGQVRVALRNAGLIDPENIHHYVARSGYAGLAKALELSPDQVIEEVRKSGLRGRGGAGFPTGAKWEFCRRSPGGEKYVICNADEGDPGAFMDRAVLESDPQSVLEGMLIAAYAIGARNGYVYVKAEIPLAIERLEKAIAQAEELGLLGDDIMGKGFSFHLHIRKGAGVFVCGEETALLASIEGKRGMPRSRPPFPAQSGLFGKPTNINNVETLANVPVILERGGESYARYGTEQSRGTKTFSLAGNIVRTGLIEVPMGISLREIVFDIGGGIPGGKRIKAVQTGGPSGGCIPDRLLDVPVDYEKLTEAGTIMGSGGMVVMDEDTCMVDIARYFLEFTQSESCGKCSPCRLGTRQMLRILNDITSGRGKPGDLELLQEIGSAVRQGSLCGLGQAAPNPVLSTIRYFRDEYEAHIEGKRCPATACRKMAGVRARGRFSRRGADHDGAGGAGRGRTAPALRPGGP